MYRAVWLSRCRGGMVVLASGALISLSVLTGGIAPALAGPGAPPIIPPAPPAPRMAAPPPAPAPRQAPAPRPAPAPREAPAPQEAPAPRVEPQAPVHDAAPAPEQTAPQPPVHDAAPAAPNSEAAPPVTRDEPATPHDTVGRPNQSAPNGPNAPAHGPQSAPVNIPPQAGGAPSPPNQDGPNGSSPGPTGRQPNQPEPNQPAPAVVRPLPGQAPGPRPGSALQNGVGPNAAPRGESPAGQAVTVHQATTMRAPQQNVATAEASVPVEHKPDPAPAADVANLRDKVNSRPTDANGWNRDGHDRSGPGLGRPDSDQHQWDHQVRQWDRNWVRYDDDYRPIICNPSTMPTAVSLPERLRPQSMPASVPGTRIGRPCSPDSGLR